MQGLSKSNKILKSKEEQLLIQTAQHNQDAFGGAFVSINELENPMLV